MRGDNLELNNKLFSKLSAEFADFLPLLMARLQCLHDFLSEQSFGESILANPQMALEALGIVEKVVGQINQEKLLAFYGLKTDSRPDAAKIKT
jgi:hypothetical protein